jgi:hypothetical protein
MQTLGMGMGIPYWTPTAAGGVIPANALLEDDGVTPLYEDDGITFLLEDA